MPGADCAFGGAGHELRRRRSSGLTLGQPPAATAAPDYYPLNSRTIKLPIKYEKDRKAIRQVMLYVARNGENTWYQEAAVPPDRDAFTLHREGRRHLLVHDGGGRPAGARTSRPI